MMMIGRGVYHSATYNCILLRVCARMGTYFTYFISMFIEVTRNIGASTMLGTVVKFALWQNDDGFAREKTVRLYYSCERDKPQMEVAAIVSW